MEVEHVKTDFDWEYRLVKRAFPPGHPFFEDGDIQCNILIKQLKVSEEIEELIQSADQFKCDTPGCAEWFSSIVRYEAHYNSIHRNRCHTCCRSFPSLHLLDIHILENHDTLFQMIAVKKHLYSCLVESCPDKFSSEEDRKDHLVMLHKYPADFRFNRKSRRNTKLKSQIGNSAGAVTQDKHEAECMDVCQTSSQVSSAEAGKHSQQRYVVLSYKQDRMKILAVQASQDNLFWKRICQIIPEKLYQEGERKAEKQGQKTESHMQNK